MAHSRRVELDALRGLLLVIMAFTHLPTRLRSYSDQPLGFVSAAEGFVFLAAYVVGETYAASSRERAPRYLRDRLWSRALRLYGYHVALLGFAFTIVASVAAATHRPALRNLLSFYFESPGLALVAGPLLLYQPPLLDILPMYIVLLALSPTLLAFAQRRGWSSIGAVSLAVWAFAQLGGKASLHAACCALTGLKLPLHAAGSFDLLAWQMLWVAGLWAGSLEAPPARPARQLPLLALAAAVAVGFFAWRHRIGGFWIDLGTGADLLDKWHLGALRLLNFGALALIISRGLLPALRRLRLELLALLGRASLQAFSAHVLACLLSLGLLVDDDTPLTSAQEAGVLSLTLGVMLMVAWRTASARARAHRLAT